MSESISNFIMKKTLGFTSNETHYNYLSIVNLINKLNNLHNREFNYVTLIGKGRYEYFTINN